MCVLCTCHGRIFLFYMKAGGVAEPSSCARAVLSISYIQIPDSKKCGRRQPLGQQGQTRRADAGQPNHEQKHEYMVATACAAYVQLAPARLIRARFVDFIANGGRSQSEMSRRGMCCRLLASCRRSSAQAADVRGWGLRAVA